LFNRLSVAELVRIRGGDHRGLIDALMTHRPSGATFRCSGIRMSRAGRIFVLSGPPDAPGSGPDVVDAEEVSLG
jgi:hypothetical protein